MNDYAIGKRHDLPMVNIFEKDATLNESGGVYKGDRTRAATRCGPTWARGSPQGGGAHAACRAERSAR